VGTAQVSIPGVEVFGAEQELSCPGAPMNAASFVEQIDGALQHVLYVRVDEATGALDRIESLLPCINEVLPREELGRIGYLKGVVLALGDRDAEAREAFRRALVVFPELDWDPRFPPAPEQLFVQAIQLALRSPSAGFAVGSRLDRDAALWLNGERVPPGGGTSSLAEGRHLLQWEAADGGFHTRVIAVRADRDVTVSGRHDVLQAAVTGHGTPAILDRATRALEELAALEGDQGLYLAQLGDVDLLHRFDEGGWHLTDHGTVARRLQLKRRADAGRGVLVAGGILTAVGAAIGISGYAVAQGLLDERPDLLDGDQHDANAAEYGDARGQAIVGLTMAGVGGGAMLASIPILASSRDRSTKAAVESASLTLSPSGVVLTAEF